MSGIDECTQDIPECPECGDRPDYWTISYNGKPILWLFSKAYRIIREERYSSNPDMRGEGYYNVLEDVFEFTSAKCMSGCGVTIGLDEHPEMRTAFYKIFNIHFPSEIKRTD